MKSTDKPPPTAIGRAVHFDGVKEKPHWDGGVVHEACIAVRGKEYKLGLFDDRIEAARCYDMACLRLHGIAIRGPPLSLCTCPPRAAFSPSGADLFPAGLNLRDSPMWVPQPKVCLALLHAPPRLLSWPSRESAVGRRAPCSAQG